MLEGPGSARPTRGRIQTGIFAPKRLQLLLLLPVRSGLWIFQGASVNQALSLCGVHPLTDKLCNLLLTTLVLPGMESLLLHPLRSPLPLLGLAGGPFWPLTTVRERLGLSKTLQS